VTQGRFIAAGLVLLAIASGPCRAAPGIVVGAKNFSEQEVLGELAAQLIERTTGLTVARRFGLGGTDICHAALVAGELDLYVEYTGTALLTVLKREALGRSSFRIYRLVASQYRREFDLEWLPPLGFNNTYAITVRGDAADDNVWTSVSDLAAEASELRAGFTSEFMERSDGYPGLREAYGFEFGRAIDLDPGLMYEAVAEGEVDVICAFATDARIAEYGLRALEDDLSFFPPYDAAPVVRRDTLRSHPQIREALAAMAGTISDREMRRLNHRVDVLGHDPRDVARDWVDGVLGAGGEEGEPGELSASASTPNFFELALKRRQEVASKTGRHLVLTAMGTVIAGVLGVPLGVLIHRVAPARGLVLAGAEIVQTIPSLAMLAFLFALYGLLGTAPAVTALVLYALLPIVLNTFTGLRKVPEQVVEAARGTGMSGWQRLKLVELPLAAPVLIAGIRTATVLTVGIATLSTYIGAGGLGDFIARGLARNDARLTLLGAVPAAIMAVTLSLVIRAIERAVTKA